MSLALPVWSNRLVVQLARFAPKALRTNELERLVARAGRIRVDAGEINVVQSQLEVGDDVADRPPRPASR